MILGLKYSYMYFYRIEHHDIDKYLLIRLRKSNYWRQNFIILNFSEYKVLKMMFSTENGRKPKILQMNYPLNIFLQNIAS